MLSFFNRHTVDTSRPSDELLKCNFKNQLPDCKPGGLPFMSYKLEVRFCKLSDDD